MCKGFLLKGLLQVQEVVKNPREVVGMEPRGMVVHSKLRSITHVVIKVHVILRSFVMLPWMRDNKELV